MNTLKLRLQNGEQVLLNLEIPTNAQPQDVLDAFAVFLNVSRSSGLPSKAAVTGKYSPLSKHLQSLNQPSVQLTFTEIERLLGFALPDSAREYRAWWANDLTHSQARAWTAAGWQSAYIDLVAETAKFIQTP